MIKVLCLDYDNTVFDHRLGNIPESAREALEAVRGKCRLVLASGRFFNDAWNAPIKELVSLTASSIPTAPWWKRREPC